MVERFVVVMAWGEGETTLPTLYKTREDDHWVCSFWRSKFGRQVEQGDPFRVEAVEVTQAEAERGL